MENRIAGDALLAPQRQMIDALAHVIAQSGAADAYLTGSFAEGNADRYSDIDLEVVGNSAAALAEARRAIDAYLATCGQMVARFAATHIQMPDLAIHFLKVNGMLVKVDVHYVRQRPGLHGGRLQIAQAAATALTAKAPGTADVRTALDQSEFLADIHQKFCGWMWYTHTKIARGEFWEAEDSLGVMRARALMPMLQTARSQPLEGFRRVEQRLSKADRDRLAETRCAAHDPVELHRSLFALTDYFEELAAEVGAGRASPISAADIPLMRSMIIASIGAAPELT